MHWINIAIEPLFEMNPIAYAFNDRYRTKKQFHLGAKATKLIFFYQCTVLAIFATSSIALAIHLLRSD